jgi:hypothetical protein
MFVYILELEKGKYYVGKTIYAGFDLTHLSTSPGQASNHSSASAWLRVFSPVKVLEIIPDCDEWDEDKITIKCMKMYGINNVRGGTFSNWKLDDSDIRTLKKMMVTHEHEDVWIEPKERGWCWTMLAYCFP